MQLPLSRSVAPNLTLVAETGSTNDDLAARASEEPDFAVLATTSQTSGRGRLGRVWVAPPGRTLAVSVLLRPLLTNGSPLPTDHYGWLPLIAGLAMTRSVAALLPEARPSLKWPNDVLVGGRKISGLLAEVVSSDAVVVGAGVNLTLAASELPVPQATSLALEGAEVTADELVDRALSGYLASLKEVYSTFLAHDGDAIGSGIRGQVSAACSTLDSRVRVELPGGGQLVGKAVGLDDTGRLIVSRQSDLELHAVAAGDVTHLRYE